MTVMMAIFYYLLYDRYIFTVFFSNCMRLLYFILDLIKPESVKNLTVDRIEYDPKEEYHPLAQIKVTISLITEKGAYFKRVYSYHPNGR